MKKTRQQLREQERQRIKDIEKGYKEFNDKFQNQETKLKATKAVLENKIIELEKELENLKSKNKEILSHWNKEKSARLNDQFMENLKK